MHRKLYGVSLISALGAIAACSAGGGDGSVSSKPAAKGAPLRSAVAARPTWATSARFRGEVPDDVTIAIQVHLQLREPDAAAAELAAISDPDGPEYGHFLSDAEYNAKYGPTDADIQALRAHLESKGLQVTHVPQNRTFIAATGTAAQVGRAFSTRLGLYNVDNDMRRAPINPPVMPDALKPLVLGVLGLTTPLQMKPRNVVVGGIQRNSIGPPPGTPAASSPMPSAAEPKAIGGTGTCSEWFGATLDTVDPPYGPGYPPLTYAPCGYLPAQIREAYGFTESVRQGNDGTGVTVAVVDAYLSPTLLADVQTYAAQNDPDYPFATSQLTTYWAPGTPTEPIPGWYIEQTLDVEAAHAIAPGAPIVAVAAQSQSDQDLVAAVNLIVENRLATIVSNSYETQEEAQLTDALIWEALATQAGLKGVGLYFSSGDSGDDQTFGISGTPSPTVDFPGSLPTVTSVGGTSLALGSLGQRLWETGWETGLSYLLDIYVPPPPPEEDASTGSPDGGGKPIPGEDSGSSLNDGTRVSPLQRVSFSTSFGEESDASDDAGVTDAGTFDGGRGPEDAGSDGGVFDGGVFDGGVFDGGVFDAGSDGGFVFDSGQPTFEEEWCPSPPGEFTFGSGGGISILFPQPAYQEGIVPSVLANAPGVPARVVPDVSMVADPVTGFLIGTSQLFGTYDEVVIGGTSLSSPLFAGVIALAQQHAKRTFGFANPLLYKASKSGAFSDAVPLASPEAVTVSPGTVATFDFGSNPVVDAGGAADAGSPGAECEFFFFNEQITIHTTVGYDDVTGLGSPSGAAFLAHVK
jgi:subtilase family serine protease